MRNINIDAKTLEMCLKSINNIGSVTYHNICTGTSTTVPWGGADWAGTLIVGSLLFGCGLFLIGLVIFFIKDVLSRGY